MATNPKAHYYTIEEWEALETESEHGYEYDHGHIYDMTGGSTIHSYLSAVITFRLNQYLYGSPCRVYNSDAKVSISASCYLYPDIVVSCDSSDYRQKSIRFPRVIIEVLSPSTEARDRGRKFILYRTLPTLQEYVLVSPKEPHVEVYRRRSDKRWQLFEFGPNDTITFESLGVEIAMQDIYEHA